MKLGIHMYGCGYVWVCGMFVYPYRRTCLQKQKKQTVLIVFCNSVIFKCRKPRVGANSRDIPQAVWRGKLWTKKVRDHNFQYNFFGQINLTVYFNISAYIHVAIIWLSFDKKLTVQSKSQTELRSIMYRNPHPRLPPNWSVQKYGKWPPLKFRQFLSMAVIFYGYILGKMLYFSKIMTTTGIKWCNDRIPEIFEFCLKNMFLTKNFEILIFVWNCCKTENPIQIWALKREIWPSRN